MMTGPLEDSHFNHASQMVVGSVVRANRRFWVATGCSAQVSSHFRAGADANVAARGQTGGGRHEPARRRVEARRRSWLPGEALVELEGRGALEQRISGGILRIARGLPQRRARPLPCFVASV